MSLKRFENTRKFIYLLVILGIVDLVLCYFIPDLLWITYLGLWALFLLDRFVYRKRAFKLVQNALHRGPYYQELIALWENLNYWNRKLIALSLVGYGIVVIVATQSAPINVGGLGMLFGTFLFIFGQRIGSQDGRRLLKSTKGKQPVLYLRSFVIDEQDEHQTHMWFGKQIIRNKEEHVLAEMFETLGPFIAIGNPKEWLPNIGAARLYVDNSQWQDEVIQLMEQSGLVLLRVGNTSGFQWEIHQVLQHVKPEHILFYFSQHLDEASLKASYDLVKGIIKQELGKTLPEAITNERVLYFDPNGDPIVTGPMEPYKKHITSGCLFLFFSRYFELSAHKKRLGAAMKPYFEQRGITSVDRALFGDLEVFLGFFITPISGGLMLFWNLFVTKKQLLGSLLFVFSIVFYLVVDYFLYPIESQQTASEALRAPDLRTGLYFTLAILVYLLWRHFGPKAIRLRLAFGGKRVSWWVTVLILVVVVGLLNYQSLMDLVDCIIHFGECMNEISRM